MTLRVLLVPGPPPDGRIENGLDRYLDALVKGIQGRVEWRFLEDPHYARGSEKKWEMPANPEPPKPRWSLLHFVPRSIRLFLGYARDTGRLARLLRPYRRQVELIHVNRVGCETQTIAARLAGFGHVVTTIHNLPGDHAPNLVERLVERLSFACGTRHIAVSNATFETWQRRIGLKRNKTATIYNGMDPEPFPDFGRRAYRAQFTSDPDTAFIIGICARLHKMKGHFVLLESCSKIPAKQNKAKPEVLLLIAGEGPERAAIERRIAELGLGDNVKLLGHRTDAARFIAALDLHVLPSVSLESMPYAVIEAMYAGVPQVVSDIGGMKEILAASGGGRIVPSGDPGALADAILYYMNNADARRGAGQKARLFAEQHLTAESMARKTLEVYEGILKAEG